MEQFQTKIDEQLQQALHATLGREKEALRLYRPMEHQIPFLLSKARFRILRGGNRCLGGEQLLYDPVLDIERRVDEIDEDFHVLSRDPETGEVVAKRACAPFVKGYGSLYRIDLSNGESLVTTMEHRVRDAAGDWVCIREAWLTRAKLWSCTHQLQVASGGDRLEEDDPQLGGCCITAVEFLRLDLIYDIAVADHHTYLCAGLLNKNSGKSLTSMASTASAATGQPIWISDTETAPYLYPTHRPRKIWLVGKSVSHIGQTLHRLLFTEDNGLRVIRDEHTKLWRAWNPGSEYDLAYKEKCKFADPFIPPRFIKPNGFGWEDKRLNHFSQVALRDGTMIYAFTSGGDAKQGDAVDLIHIDEDIDYADHVWEWAMRLADFNGYLTWSAYPHSTNEALRKFHSIAEEEVGKASPIAEEFVLRFDQNEYIDKETRDQQLQVLLYSGEATYRARNLGEFTFDTSLVYPSFSQKIHTALISDEKKRDEIDRILRERAGEPPENWTRYFVIDPGHSVCAGLFLAVPPPELGDYVIAYDEVYQRQSDAHKMAEACAVKMAGHSFQDFIMDWHGGRQTPMGMSKTVKMIYREAFQAFGLRCVVRGNDFAWGSDNVSGRIEQVRGWLSLKDNNLPTLRLYLPRTPHLQKEFGTYSMRIRSGEICDEPIAQNNHLMDTLSYAAAAGIKYILPRRSTQQLNPAYRAFAKERSASQRSRRPGATGGVNFGPGAAHV